MKSWQNCQYQWFPELETITSRSRNPQYCMFPDRATFIHTTYVIVTVEIFCADYLSRVVIVINLFIPGSQIFAEIFTLSKQCESL